jgi:hypothetical protein
MIRTRYVAAGVAVSLLSLPFIGASPASAAAGQVAVTGPLQTGDTEVIDFTDGDETGAYTVELWQTTKVATISSGSDITALADLNWTIPTGVTAYVGAGFTIKVAPGTGATFTAFESSSFAIEASNVNTVAGQGTTWATGVAKTITWDNTGATGDLVDISIVDSAGKAKAIVKKTANDETESVTLPLSTVAATGYKVKVTPSNKAATAGESAAVEVTATAAPSVAVTDDTITRGDELEVTPTSTSGNVKLDLVLASAPTKSVAVLSKSAASGDPVAIAWPAKLAAGTYKVVATVLGSKPVVTASSADITVAAFPAITIATGTADALAAKVTQGQTVTVAWTSAATEDPGYVVSYVIDGKETKINAKATSTAGDGSVSWLTSSKVGAGTTYTIKVAYAADPTVSVSSSAFHVVANTTTLATD